MKWYRNEKMLQNALERSKKELKKLEPKETPKVWLLRDHINLLKDHIELLKEMVKNKNT